MKREIKITDHAVKRFNERVGFATRDDLFAEIGRAKSKHFRALRKIRPVAHFYIPTPVAVFIGSCHGDKAIVKTVIARGAA